MLLAVKSHHTAEALGDLAPRLAPDGTIVSLQNGLSEEQIARAVGPARTVGCLVNWAADWVAPGRILHGGHGAFVLGELDGRITPRVRELAELLSAVVATPVTDNIWGYKWAKHIYGALLLATALVDAHVYEVVERSAEVQRRWSASWARGWRSPTRPGVRLEPFDEFDPAWYRAALGGRRGGASTRAMAAIAQHYRAHTKTKTGIWRDLVVRKRKTEVDGQLGMLARKGEALGVAMPLTRRLAELIGDLEDGRRPMDWANLERWSRSRAGDARVSAPVLALPGPAEVGAARRGVGGDPDGARAHDRRAGSASRAARARRRPSTTSSGRSRATASRWSAARSRPTSACRWRAACILPDGAAIEGLTHSFSTLGRGARRRGGRRRRRRPGGLRARGRGRQDRAPATGWRPRARRGPRRRRGRLGQIFVNLDHLHNMIVTTIWGTPAPDTAWRIPRMPCLSVLRRRRRAPARR